jgi:nucleotide-binding universal stress UspA family protein
MYSVIMVPMDGSDFGRHALPWALAVARPARAGIRLVHAFMTPHALGAADAGIVVVEAWEAQRAAQGRALREDAERLAAATGLAVTAAVEDGATADALLRHAEAHGVNLIVMTTHGRGGLGRAILGSTADELVRRSGVPVLLARPHGAAPNDTEVAAVRHVLVPLDGSPVGGAVVPHAAELCALTGAACTLLHVEVPAMLTGAVPPDALVEPGALRAEAGAAAAYLERVAGELRARGVSVATEVVRGEQVAPAVVAWAEAHAPTLIAMATHGRRGLERLMLGSVGSTLLQKTRLPLLLVRA